MSVNKSKKNVAYKLFVLKILNFSIDLNSLTWLKKMIKMSDKLVKKILLTINTVKYGNSACLEKEALLVQDLTMANSFLYNVLCFHSLR